MRLGIDFGTTRTVVATARDGRYPVASFATGEGFVDYLPGIAALGPGGLRFGTEAAALLAAGGTGLPPLLRSVKAAVSGMPPDDIAWRAGELSISALDLATAYLCYLRRMLLEHSNVDLAADEPLEAMVAVPAHASTQQRYLTLEAFAGAGFSVLGLISEPTAAAIEFARNSLAAVSPRSPKRYVVIYDLGGGTFDAATVSLDDRRFDLIGAEGIARLGGNDFDALIAEAVLAHQRISCSRLCDTRWNHLLERCRIAKETLGTSSRRLLVDVGGLAAEGVVVLDTAALYESAMPLIERTLATLARLFEQLATYGIDANSSRELGAVYLVGGSVQFPAVQRALRKAFARKVQLAPQPHAATAVGLAVAADDAAEVYVREAPTRHFGVWREGDGGREKFFDPIIEKRMGSRPPAGVRAERHYRPAHRVGTLRYVECTQLDANGEPSGEVTPWRRVEFPYDPALRNSAELSSHSGQRLDSLLPEDIVESYVYDDTGMITVTIRNETHGYGHSFQLGMDSPDGTARGRFGGTELQRL